MTPDEIKRAVIPPQAIVCARLVLRGFGHEVATEHVRAALMELIIWQENEKQEREGNSPRNTA